MGKKDALTVSLIRIRNVLGIEHLDVRPGALTVIEGSNGAGKSSVLEAIKSVVEGGADASLVKHGAEAGEVVLVLSDGVEIRKRITAEGGASLTVQHPDGYSLSKPKGFVDGLLDALAFNPVKFLTAPPRRRVEYLLDAMPLTVTAEEVQAAIGCDVDASEVAGHALPVIDRFHQRVYDERTGVNRIAKEKRHSARELGQSLPPIVPADPERESGAALRQQREDAKDRKFAALAEVERECQAEIDRHRRELQQSIDEMRATAATRAREISAAAEPALQRLTAAAAAADERERAEALHENTRAFIARAEHEAAETDSRAERLTAALGRLDALKGRLLEDLPLPGIEVRGGELFHAGIPWDRVNTAERVKVALGLAQLRARGAKLPLVCVDGLECLDAETFAVFRQKAPAAGLQLIVTRVGEGPLQVDEIPAPDGAQ